VRYQTRFSLAHQKRPLAKTEPTPRNAKGLTKKTSDEKRSNPKKRKGAHQKRPPTKKETIPKNKKGLIKKTSDKKEATPRKGRSAPKKCF
jgi:hypothetical protein